MLTRRTVAAALFAGLLLVGAGAGLASEAELRLKQPPRVAPTVRIGPLAVAANAIRDEAGRYGVQVARVGRPTVTDLGNGFVQVRARVKLDGAFSPAWVTVTLERTDFAVVSVVGG